MSTWNLIQSRVSEHTLSLLARKDIELRTDTKAADYFFCEVNGKGPYKPVGRIVTSEKGTRIFVHSDVATSELMYLTSALVRLEHHNWTMPEVVDYGSYPDGVPYKRAFVCRPLGEDDLSVEAFERVDLTHSRVLKEA